MSRVFSVRVAESTLAGLFGRAFSLEFVQQLQKFLLLAVLVRDFGEVCEATLHMRDDGPNSIRRHEVHQRYSSGSQQFCLMQDYYYRSAAICISEKDSE
jgi:hypothetical protein